MTPSKLEQEALSRFDERFNDKLWPVHDLREDINGELKTWVEATKLFLLQEIRSAVEKREKEIVEMIDSHIPVRKTEYPTHNTYNDGARDTLSDIKNLITNKK